MMGHRCDVRRPGEECTRHGRAVVAHDRISCWGVLSYPVALWCPIWEPTGLSRALQAYSGLIRDLGSRRRQDLRAVLGHHQGVLELGSAGAVLRDDRPAVVPLLPFLGAQGEHGLDGENHADLSVIVNFSPVQNFSAGTTAEEVQRVNELSFEEFKKMFDRYVKDNKRLGFT